MDTCNFFAGQRIWKNEASLFPSATGTAGVFAVFSFIGVMWWVGCALHYLSQLPGEAANELLPTLDGESVSLGSLGCQSETGLTSQGTIL